VTDRGSLDLPIQDPAEVAAFLDSVPLAVDRQKFTRFVLGFPRRYLAARPRVEIVKHYALMESQGDRPVISALGRDADLWKVDLICHDRKFLFSRIAGSLSARGMNIVSAEAFANESEFVLDTFRFADPESALADLSGRRAFQELLEGIVVGKVELEPLLAPRLALHAGERWRARVSFENDSHPAATKLTLESPDVFGLLYRVTRCLSDAGCNIETAYVRTPGGHAEDVFYLSKDGRRLDQATATDVAERLAALGTGPARAAERA
jgi:[protein-PII] uridylyltransferase